MAERGPFFPPITPEESSAATSDHGQWQCRHRSKGKAVSEPSQSQFSQSESQISRPEMTAESAVPPREKTSSSIVERGRQGMSDATDEEMPDMEDVNWTGRGVPLPSPRVQKVLIDNLKHETKDAKREKRLQEKFEQAKAALHNHHGRVDKRREVDDLRLKKAELLDEIDPDELLAADAKQNSKKSAPRMSVKLARKASASPKSKASASAKKKAGGQSPRRKSTGSIKPVALKRQTSQQAGLKRASTLKVAAEVGGKKAANPKAPPSRRVSAFFMPLPRSMSQPLPSKSITSIGSEVSKVSSIGSIKSAGSNGSFGNKIYDKNKEARIAKPKLSSWIKK